MRKNQDWKVGQNPPGPFLEKKSQTWKNEKMSKICQKNEMSKMIKNIQNQFFNQKLKKWKTHKKKPTPDLKDFKIFKRCKRFESRARPLPRTPFGEKITDMKKLKKEKMSKNLKKWKNDQKLQKSKNQKNEKHTKTKANTGFQRFDSFFFF